MREANGENAASGAALHYNSIATIVPAWIEAKTQTGSSPSIVGELPV